MTLGIDISKELLPPPSEKRLFLKSVSSYKSVRSHIPEGLAHYFFFSPGATTPNGGCILQPFSFSLLAYEVS